MTKKDAVFDETKLDWMNGQYIKGMGADAWVQASLPWLMRAHARIAADGELEEDARAAAAADIQRRPERYARLYPLVAERLSRLDEIPDKLGFLFWGPNVLLDEKSVAKVLAKEGARADEALAACRAVLADEGRPWEAEPLQEACRALCEPSRHEAEGAVPALARGRERHMVSPPLFESIELLAPRGRARPHRCDHERGVRWLTRSRTARASQTAWRPQRQDRPQGRTRPQTGRRRALPKAPYRPRRTAAQARKGADAGAAGPPPPRWPSCATTACARAAPPASAACWPARSGPSRFDEDGNASVDGDACTNCGICLGICDGFSSTRVTMADLYERLRRIALRGEDVVLTCKENVFPGLEPAANVVVLPCLATLSPEFWALALAENIPVKVACDLSYCADCDRAGEVAETLYSHAIETAEKWTRKRVGFIDTIPEKEQFIKDLANPVGVDRRSAFTNLVGDVGDIASGKRRLRKLRSAPPVLRTPRARPRPDAPEPGRRPRRGFRA